MLLFLLWLPAEASASACELRVDGAPAPELDCELGGRWTVWCPLPAERSGQVRLRVSAPALGIAGEARVPLSHGPQLEVPLSGPGGRAGAFLVSEAAAGLLPGQAVGPAQWCPVVQPGVSPGSARTPVALSVEVTLHARTGFAEAALEGGVVSRVPTFDAGARFARAEATIWQRTVGTIPVLTGPGAIPLGEPVSGQLSLATEGGWRSIGWSGELRELPVDSGVVRVLVLDFVAPEVGFAAGGDPVAWLVADLARWGSGDDTAWLGLAAWARSGFEAPLPTAFRAEVRGGVAWERAADDRRDVRVGGAGDRLRVLIAGRRTPLDAAALAAIDEAGRAGLD